MPMNIIVVLIVTMLIISSLYVYLDGKRRAFLFSKYHEVYPPFNKNHNDALHHNPIVNTDEKKEPKQPAEDQQPQIHKEPKPTETPTPDSTNAKNLVFGIEAPNKEAAARAANHRETIVRDVLPVSIPTRLAGNSNSVYGLITGLTRQTDPIILTLESPSFPFHSSTHYEDAKVQLSSTGFNNDALADADDAMMRRNTDAHHTYSSL